MNAVLFYLVLPLIYGISFLPFWLLYRFSDFMFFVVYRLIGYRKKVVAENLRKSFPNKSEEELKDIERKFYVFFCDLIVETIKSLTISPNTLKKRLTFQDLSVFEKYFKANQSIIIVMGHWGNWELGGARFALEPLHRLFVIYHPLHNKHFDGLVYKMRTRLGNGLYAMKDTLRGMIRDRNELTATAFIADQTPSRRGAHWMEFLHQDTPVFTGTGKIANKMSYPVVYVSINRPRRGHYKIALEDLVPEPQNVEPHTIVERFMHRLEKDIEAVPEIWLWTHRRWKHKREA